MELPIQTITTKVYDNKCSLCKNKGHNKRTCNQTNDNPINVIKVESSIIIPPLEDIYTCELLHLLTFQTPIIYKPFINNYL
jgi:hypothetical protein